MKEKILKLKTILFFISVMLLYNCSDKCSDNDLATNFPAKFKIVSSDGSNQLLASDFDISLLKIINPRYSNSFGFDFSVEELNNEIFIETQIVNTTTIVFEYDGIQRFEVIFSDIENETIDCVVETLSFTANSSDGNLLCDCDINEFVMIEFDI